MAIGLLDEAASLFPDQTTTFVLKAEIALREALGTPLRVLAPLIGTSKREVIEMARSLGIKDTYSCHRGTSTRCGRCVACREYIAAEV